MHSMDAQMTESASISATKSILKGPTAVIRTFEADISESIPIEARLRSAGYAVTHYMGLSSLLENYDGQQPGCVVLRLSETEPEAVLSAQKSLRKMNLPATTVIVARQPTVSQVIDLMRNGAVDVLQDPFGDELLFARIDEAVSRDAADRARLTRIQTIRRQLERLTLREKQVLFPLGRGETPKSIATRFNLSVKTVQSHRANIMRKLSLDNYAALIHFAVESSTVGGVAPAPAY